MTNITAALMVLVVTNWESVGEFTDKSGHKFDVQEAKRWTNTVAVFDFENKRQEFTLKSVEGDKVGEKKEPEVFWITNFGIFYTNSMVSTNVLSPTNYLDLSK